MNEEKTKEANVSADKSQEKSDSETVKKRGGCCRDRKTGGK